MDRRNGEFVRWNCRGKRTENWFVTVILVVEKKEFCDRIEEGDGVWNGWWIVDVFGRE